MQERTCPSRLSNFRDRVRNRCARDAIKSELNRIGKRCLRNDDGDCNDLGEYAAQMVIRSEVCSRSRTQGLKDFQRTCRSVARGVCEGYIMRAVKNECCGERVSLSKQRRLQAMCRSEVNSLTSRKDEEGDFMNTI